MRVHLQLTGDPERVAGQAAELEALGADGAFTFEGPHDVFLPLAAAAGQTDLQLMTNVAIAGPRSPIHLAHSAYDLQVYSRGRFRLGLGSQIKVHIEKRYGARWESPAALMGETVAAIKAIFAAWEGQASLDFRGRFHTHTLMPPNFSPGQNPYGMPPVLLGALGPIMTRTAAEVADGLLVMPFHSRRHFTERTLPAVEEGLHRSGRSRSDFAIIPQAMVALGRTEEQLAAAVAGVGSLVAFYGSTPAYRPVLDVQGWGDLQPELNRLSKAGDYPGMRALISDETVAVIGVVGTPEECAAQLDERFGAHADEVCCYFPGYRPEPELIGDFVRAVQARRRPPGPDHH